MVLSLPRLPGRSRCVDSVEIAAGMLMVRCLSFGVGGLLEWVMLSDSEEALRCRGPIHPSTAAV